MVDYYRTTRDGRIAFGKGTGAISYGSRIGRVFDVDRESLALTEADFRRTYPSLGDIPLVDGWSGPIDRTYDSLPVSAACTRTSTTASAGAATAWDRAAWAGGSSPASPSAATTRGAVVRW